MRQPIHEHPGFFHVGRLLSGGSPPPPAAELLASLGISDMERTARSLQSLALHPSFPREDSNFLSQFLESLGETFEPERALANLERILESRENPDALLSALHRSANRRSIVLTLAGGSQFLADTVHRHPAYLDWLLRPATLRDERPKAKLLSELWRWARASRNEPGGPADALRRFRQREYLRIGIRDLLRMASMRETVLDLSRLADATLETALRIAQIELHERYGKPRWRNPAGRRIACEYAVIGMGKLGGQELNFSSDIDLLFIYSSDEGETAGVRDPYTGRRSGIITNHEFSVRLTQRLIQLMTETTGEGHVFRIDTRLRPEGAQGALAYSLRSCEVYYESWGETWERQALIKARLCAGSADLGRDFQEMIRPFIYRRTLDISALDEIAHIKDRINTQLAAGGRGGLNIKLGEGGIREIEFIIQSYQLIYGGKEPILQTPNSLQALLAIKDLGFLPIADCAALAEAYVFLRDVEHRVQVTHGLQTHDLPADPHGLTVLARKMGFRASEGESEKGAFEAALKDHQEIVVRIFESLFRRGDAPPPAERGKEDPAPERPESAITLEDSLSPSDLAPYNFADPAASSTLLRLLRNGEPFQHISARAKRLFDELLPRLLYITLDLPDPDRAVANLYRFAEKGGGREAVFSLLGESERVFEALLKVFGSSDYLSEIAIRRPDILDAIFREGWLARPKTGDALLAEIQAAARKGTSMETRFTSLSEAKRGEELLIGMRSLLGEDDILATLSELTRLADAVLGAGLTIAEEEIDALYGAPSGGAEAAGFAVIGLGKLGSGEMNFGSDLDLIFTCGTPDGETSGRSGARPPEFGAIPNHEYYFKLGAALRDGLSAPGAGERAYEMDLRLRPEGREGSLVAPLDQIGRYLDARAESWERQALCRARPIAGSPEVGEAFMSLAARFVYESPLPDDFAAGIARMRGRMERELAREAEGNIDIKLGRGSITDIDFIVQFLQITVGRENPTLRHPGTFGAIQAFREAGLLPVGEAEDLSAAYRFLRLLESRLRIARAQPIHTLPQSPEEMEILARRTGFEDDDEGSSRAKLLATYENHTRRVRAVFENLIGGVDAGAAKT